MSLTDLQIKKLRAPKSGQKTHFDASLRGFGIRVSQGGTKTFIVLCGAKRTRKTLGRYPDLSLSEARILAKKAQADFALGPKAARQVAPRVSFIVARDKFLADAEKRTKPRTVDEYRRLLHRHFHFAMPVDEINRTDVVTILDGLAETPSEQKHAFVALRTMMNWCTRRGWLLASPVPPLTFKAETRSRILNDAELKAVWQRADEIGYQYGRIIQLLILTGQRRGEIAGLRYSWIDDGKITFPFGFAKNKREHVIPIGAMCLDLIENLPESVDLLFPSRLSDEATFNGWSRAKRNFDVPIDVPDYTLHDLRRTFSSNLARIGTPIHVTEKLLNHVSGTVSGVAAVYNRYSYFDEMSAALKVHDEFLTDLLSE